VCGWLSLHHDIAQSAVGMWPMQNVVKCIVHITLPAPLKVVCNKNLGVSKMAYALGVAIDILLTYDLMSSFIHCIAVFPTALMLIPCLLLHRSISLCALSYDASFHYALKE
jgi:hypothetical protein